MNRSMQHKGVHSMPLFPRACGRRRCRMRPKVVNSGGLRSRIHDAPVETLGDL
ncbi:hypothetical protein [Caballeronia concitans]|uniref:hypothetical protein n=1 Tax=Caballeronia concitans TaxID=1777133 RepID=UPI001356454C|nr:hypothetical protein [Caballeronia concitans]